MRLDIVTLFPGMFAGPMTESIMARAQRSGLVTVRLVDLREFATDERGTVDDRPFGGGAGMVLKPEPLFAAVDSVRTPAARVVLMTPQGVPFRQRTAERLSLVPHLIVVCGHYEGVDERFRQAVVDEEISLGDFVLTNGSLPAMVLADAVIRLLPGALGSPDSAISESFGTEGLLEYPQYTRPEDFRGLRVPEVLLSGDHARIAAWRHEQQGWRTLGRRPDLLTDAQE
jgi:tRNA (guanine37-N1)-methyltransferase